LKKPIFGRRRKQIMQNGNSIQKPALLKNGNPRNPNNAPRCGAKNRQGKPCMAPAMKV